MSSASQIKAGDAFVSLSFNDKDLEKGLASASKKLKSWGAGLEKIGGGLVAGGLGILAPLTAAVATFASMGTELQNASLRLNETVENLSALKSAAEESGVEFDTLEHSLNHFQRSLQDGNAVKAFREIHLNAGDLKGKGLADQFTLVADALVKVKDNGVAAAAAQALFGKAGEKILGIARESASGLGNLVEEMKDLDLVMSGEDAKNAKEFGTNLKRIEGMAKMAAVSVGGELVQALMKFKEPVMGAVRDITDLIKENRGLAVSVGAIGIGLVAAGASFIALGAAISGIGSIVGALGTAFGFLTSVPGLAVAAAAGLVYLWTQTDGGKATIGGLRDEWMSSWDAMKASVQSGDFATAFEIMFDTIKLSWVKFWESIRAEMNKQIAKIAPTSIKTKDTTAGLAAEAWRGWQEFDNLTMLWGRQLIHLDLNAGQAEYKRATGELAKESRGIAKELEAMDKEPKESDRLAELLRKKKAKVLMGLLEAPSTNKIAGKMDSLSNPELMGLGESSKGTFSPYAISQSLAIGDKVSDKIAQSTAETAKNTADIAKTLSEISKQKPIGQSDAKRPLFKDDGG